MQDIIAPQAPHQKIKPIGKKKSKIIYFVAGFLTLFIIVFATFYITKNYFSDNKKIETNKKVDVAKESNKEEGEFVYVSSKPGLNLRSDSSTQGDVVWTLPYRAKIKVLNKSEDGTWYKTTYEEITGWFKKEYTQDNEPTDGTKAWTHISKKGDLPFSLKYPENWKVKTIETEQNSFSVISSSDPRSLVSVEILSAPLAQISAALVSEGKNIGGQTLFSLNGAKGKKYIIQTVVNNKVIYTEDVILIEKNNKVIKIVGPADGEIEGDTFNELVWTITF